MIIRYYDEGITWAPLKVAEGEVERNGKKAYVFASPGEDDCINIGVSNMSLVRKLEAETEKEDPEDSCQIYLDMRDKCFTEEYFCVRDALKSEYWDEILEVLEAVFERFNFNPRLF